MSPLLAPLDDASTPLTPEEATGLRPTYITTRGELNAAEQANIADGTAWAWRRQREVLDAAFLRWLHDRMFGAVWDWAGTFRTTARNIGVPAPQIAPHLHDLLEDARYWIAAATYPADEIAARFHHRLVYIHPFPNGNGRHGRLAADLLLRQLGCSPFTWGAGDLVEASALRQRYVAALRAADAHDLGPLLVFVRSGSAAT